MSQRPSLERPSHVSAALTRRRIDHNVVCAGGAVEIDLMSVVSNSSFVVSGGVQLKNVGHKGEYDSPETTVQVVPHLDRET